MCSFTRLGSLLVSVHPVILVTLRAPADLRHILRLTLLQRAGLLVQRNIKILVGIHNAADFWLVRKFWKGSVALAAYSVLLHGEGHGQGGETEEGEELHLFGYVGVVGLIVCFSTNG